MSCGDNCERTAEAAMMATSARTEHAVTSKSVGDHRLRTTCYACYGLQSVTVLLRLLR